MGITDYNKAFSEGWGEQFQVFANLDVPQYADVFINKKKYSNIAMLWHSNIDEELRFNAAIQGKYIFEKLMPDNIDLSELNPEQLILLYHTSPLFNICKLKNAQQMLACEGMISSLFYQINSSPDLQNNYLDSDFYYKYLLAPIPAQLKPQELFTPYENVMLKNFWVWHQMKDKIGKDNDTPVFITFINEWCYAFPSDKETIIALFIKSTIGKTVTDSTGKIYEKAAFYGMMGDYQNYITLRKEYNEAIDKVVKEVIEGKVAIDANIGKELWIENKDLQVRTTLWSDKNKKNLCVNLNTASIYELATFSKIGLLKAKEIMKAREKLGYFKSVEEAEKYGFVH
jgi:hypothetical protein